MKKAILIINFFLLISGISISNAQDVVQESNYTVGNSGFYAGGQASTNGLGLQAAYILNRKFTFRTGFETMNLKFNFNFDENDISYNADFTYKTGGIFLIADYFFTSHLYSSLGGVLNSFNPNINGEAVSDMQYGDISIPAEDVGDFKFTIQPQLKIAPYVSVGFRQFLGKKEHIVYNFETGFYYMGEPKINIEATGLLSPTADPAHGQEDYLQNQLRSYKVYPIVKLNIAFKLF